MTVVIAISFGIIGGGLLVFIIFHKKILSDRYSFTFSDKEKESSSKNPIGNADLALYADVTKALEQERKRIGSDIHDEMAAYLSSFLVDIAIVKAESGNLSREADARLNKMQNKITYTIDALRRIIYGMLPDSLEQRDLNFALKELCNRFDGMKGAKTIFTTSGEPVLLTDQQKLFVFRIAQELMNNSIKHSLAWNIQIVTSWSPTNLTLLVKDDGRGITTYQKNANQFGLTGIFVRANVINATAKFNNPTKGTEFELTVPLTND